MATVFCLLTLMIIEVFAFIRPVFSSNISIHWGPSDTYYMIWWTGTHSLAQKMLHQLFCVEPLCHPVLTSPFNQHEHISFMSVNFYLKIQQLSLYIFFSPAAAVTSWLSSRGCRLRPASPGLLEKVIQRWSLPDFMKDWLANDWCQINVDLGVLVIFGSCICLGEETSYHMS